MELGFLFGHADPFRGRSFGMVIVGNQLESGANDGVRFCMGWIARGDEFQRSISSQRTMRSQRPSIRIHPGSVLTPFLLCIGLLVAASQRAIAQTSPGGSSYDATANFSPGLSSAVGLSSFSNHADVDLSSRQAEATFGRALFGSAAGGLISGTLTAGTMAFTGWFLTGQSRTGAEAGAWIGGIPGVVSGSAMGAKLALAGTDREPSLIGSILGSLAATGAGIVVWKQVAGNISPEEYDARWRRGVAAGWAVESVLAALFAYGL